jgi:hypothetical protein
MFNPARTNEQGRGQVEPYSREEHTRACLNLARDRVPARATVETGNQSIPWWYPVEPFCFVLYCCFPQRHTSVDRLTRKLQSKQTVCLLFDHGRALGR